MGLFKIDWLSVYCSTGNWINQKTRQCDALIDSVELCLTSKIIQLKEIICKPVFNGNIENQPPEFYSSFDKHMYAKPTCCRKKYVYIVDALGNKRRERVLRKLGKGAHKQAFELTGGRALIVPRFTGSKADLIAWESTVDNEVYMAQQFSSKKLLCQIPQKVMVSCSGIIAESIPAYATTAFHSLELRNWFIIDKNNQDSSTAQKVFCCIEKRFSEADWKLAFAPLFNDIAKIIASDLHTDHDSSSLVLVKDSNSSSHLSVRYFGFDFPSTAIRYSSKARQAEDLVSGMVRRVLEAEFSGHDSYQTQVKVRDLEFELIKFGLEAVTTRLKS